MKTMQATQTTRTPPTHSLGKRWVFGLALAVIVLISIEGLAHLLYFASYQSVYSPNDLAKHAARQNPDAFSTGNAELAEIVHRRILHPYLGYAIDRAETMGMPGDVYPIQKRSAGKFIVAVTGGSVGNQVCSALGPALREAFEQRQRALEPVVVCLTIDGFKQPQQLISINFLLSLGAEFDAVINVDGFNDIVLPTSENYPKKVYPFYPRAWDSFVNRRPSQSMILGAGEIAYLRQQQIDRIRSAETSILGRSAVLGFYLSRELDRSASRIAAIQQKLLAETVDLPFEARGPYEQLDDIAQVYHAAAEVWATSSVLMHGLLTNMGIAYFHVLQPNQYVAGSKVLSATEKKLAYNMNHPYAASAVRGYPYLFEASAQIVDAGVHFMDATQIFHDMAEDVYKDDCCHVNRLGKQTIAKSIARWVTGSHETAVRSR